MSNLQKPSNTQLYYPKGYSSQSKGKHRKSKFDIYLDDINALLLKDMSIKQIAEELGLVYLGLLYYVDRRRKECQGECN